MLTITPVDDVFVHIACDQDIANELSDYFKFDVPGARFMQQQQAKASGNKYGKWDGKIKLFKLRTHQIYRGLVPRILEFAKDRDYEVINKCPDAAMDGDGINGFLAQFPLKYPVRDYQHAALIEALNTERCIIQSPTGSGKSYIIYLLLQYLGERALIVVPTIGLVTQMVSDFRDYGDKEPIATIHAGKSKRTDTMITVSTWQSIYEQPNDWFAQFKVVVVDEVHTAKSKSLTGLMEKCTTVPYRFGFTGTIDNTECHRLVLEGLFGTVTKVTTTDDLIKSKQLAQLRVKMCVLQYPDLTRKQMARRDYPNELDFLTQEPARNEFIARLVCETKGNTLVLFQFVQKHGLGLFKRITELAAERGKQVHYIAGAVNGEDRERIRQAAKTGDNHIIVASYGTFQLGVNVPSLRNLVFAHPAKSPIRVLQSIGRVLRLDEGKTGATLIDIADDLRWKRYTNHCFRHAAEREQYYSTEKFPVTMKQIDVAQFTQMIPTVREDAPQSTTTLEGEAECQ